MKYQVLIPCAGTGSRLKDETRYLNKSLIHIENKPIISHIIDKFPKDCEFIIPVGYRGADLVDYLNIAYEDRNFTFEYIEPYEGEGSSLGYTLSKVIDKINGPFVFISCDTLVSENIPDPSSNWIGYSNTADSSDYRTLDVNGLKAIKLNEKLESKSKKAYIGLAGIKDYEEFVNLCKSNKKQFHNKGESYPLSEMINNFDALQFQWFDTGSIPGLNLTRKTYLKNNLHRHNILEKLEEKIWFVNNKVIKFSNDEEFIKNRINRSNVLKNFVPKIIDQKKNMYSYKYIEGEVISNNINPKIFDELLKLLEDFWVPKNLSEKEYKDFTYSCHEFYKDKTFQRLEMFFNMYPYSNKTVNLNGNQIDDPFDSLDKINWQKLSEGIATTFHGDLHFENILYDNEKFTFLDWRQNFNGLLNYGDIYYDLSKLLHGILLPHPVVTSGSYSILESENDVNIQIELSSEYREIYKLYIEWLEEKKYDTKKVHILCALIYLNIAPLHHHPYSRFLFYYGLDLLNRYVE